MRTAPGFFLGLAALSFLAWLIHSEAVRNLVISTGRLVAELHR